MDYAIVLALCAPFLVAALVIGLRVWARHADARKLPNEVERWLKQRERR